MFSFSGDPRADDLIQQTIDPILDRLARMPESMLEEMQAWERDDLNRRLPQATFEHRDTVVTTVVQHTRRRMRARMAIERLRERLRGARGGAPPGKPSYPRASRARTLEWKPILRPYLRVALHGRMRGLLDTIWRG